MQGIRLNVASSRQRRICSIVPQRVVLEPVLLNFLINDLKMEMNSDIPKYGDEIKVFLIAEYYFNDKKQQKDLTMSGWS